MQISQPALMTDRRITNRWVPYRHYPSFLFIHRLGIAVPIKKINDVNQQGLSCFIAQKLESKERIQLGVQIGSQTKESIEIPGEVLSTEPHSNIPSLYICRIKVLPTIETQSKIINFLNRLNSGKDGIWDRRGAGRQANCWKIYNPQLYATHQLSRENENITVRNLRADDIEELLRVEISAWGEEMAATREMFQSRLETFPEGMIGAFSQEKLLGYICLIRFNSSSCDKEITWLGVTDNGFIKNSHNPEGDCLYGVSLSSSPGSPKELAVKLIKAAAKLSMRLELKGVLFGARVPSYHKYAAKMTIDEYMKARTSKGKMLDPELYFYRQVNACPLKPLPNYFEDPESLNYGVLGFFENPLYALQKREFPFFFDSVSIHFT
ncbi:MAG: hypothetical protein ACKVQC_06680 [Elusimicrobiota bacterium]